MLGVGSADIYGPEPGQPPVFTIEGVSVCLAHAAGTQVLLATGATDDTQVLRVCRRILTELGDWFDLQGLSPIVEEHYRKFRRIGHMTAQSGKSDEWPFTFTVDPAGTVVLYPTPHKKSLTITGRLIAPRPPALFTKTRIDAGEYSSGSEHDQLAQHLAALMALNRIEAAVTVVADDRTYRAPGHNALSARIYFPYGPMEPDVQAQWLHSVLAATIAVPYMSARPSPLPASADTPPDVIVEYYRPRRPWRIHADAPAD